MLLLLVREAVQQWTELRGVRMGRESGTQRLRLHGVQRDSALGKGEWNNMKCVVCEVDMVVVDSRDMEWNRRRRYKCEKCGRRYTTREVLFVEDTPAWQEIRHDTLRREDDIRRMNKRVRSKKQSKR